MRTSSSRRSMPRLTMLVSTSALFLGACATAGAGPSSTATPAPSGGATGAGSATPIAQSGRWSVSTAPQVDLWLHSLAMISRDTVKVPLYRRGYRDSVTAVRSRSNVLTALDGNREKLAERLATSPNYLQAQFLALDFSSWDEMKLAAERFLQFEGEPRRAPDERSASRVAQFASVFPTASDRDWLRLFVASVQDENVRWFAGEQAKSSVSRAAVVSAVDTLMRRYYPKFERFLNNTGQRNGVLLLSAPIGGEGRAGSNQQRQTVIASTLPGRADDAIEALLVFAHEITGTLVGNVVTDNTSPADARAGLGERYVSAGQVRAGAMVLEKIAPELVVPYMRYYLAQTGTMAGSNLAATFNGTFELPKAIADGLLRQIEIVLGGI